MDATSMMNIETIREVFVETFGAENVSITGDGDRATVWIFTTMPRIDAQIVEILCREIIRRKGAWGDDSPFAGERCSIVFSHAGQP